MKNYLAGALRVIAKFFSPKPYGHRLINRIEGAKTNNTVQNPEWVDRERSTPHHLKNGRTGCMPALEKEALLKRVLLGGEQTSISNFNWQTPRRTEQDASSTLQQDRTR